MNSFMLISIIAMKHEALITLTGASSQNGVDVARETEGRGGGCGHDAGDQQGAAGEPAACARGQALPHHHQGGLCYAAMLVALSRSRLLLTFGFVFVDVYEKCILNISK